MTLFPDHPHEVTITDYGIERQHDAVRWLRDQMEPEDWRYWGNGTFKFRSDRDAVAFKLAWGCC